MNGNDHEFQLLMGRLTNQDDTLKRIDGKLDTVIVKVEDHDSHIRMARRVAKWGGTIAATGVGAGLIKWLGWK